MPGRDGVPNQKPASSYQFSIKQITLVVLAAAVLFGLIHWAREASLAAEDARLRKIESHYQRQVDSLGLAIRAYANLHSEYPIENSSTNDLRLHLLRRFRVPNAALTDAALTQISELNPSEQLVFWLSDAVRPMTTGEQRRPFYDFDPRFLVDFDVDGFPEFVSPEGTPFIYSAGAVRVRSRRTQREILVELDLPIWGTEK